MTQISRDDVQYLAQLSNLELTDSEVDSLGRDLANILEYIEQLSGLDTEGIEPTYQVTDLQNVWRKDEKGNYGLERDALLQLAPDSQDSQVKVPKVL